MAVHDAGTGQAWQSPEPAGSSAVATAALAPAGTTPATGSVTYSLHADGAWASPAIFVRDGGAQRRWLRAASRPTGALSAGAYGFAATYSGDALHGAATSPCAPFAVAAAQPVTPSASGTPASAAYGNTVILSAAGLPSDATSSVTFSTGPSTLCTATAFTITPAAPAFHFIAPPSIQIAQPVNAAHYLRRETVRASYRCSDGPGAPGLVPGSGRLTAVETAWRSDRPEPRTGHQTVLSRGSLNVRRAGRVSVTVRPVASGRRLLRRSRGQRLRVRLLVTYTPTGGDERRLSKYGLLHIR